MTDQSTNQPSQEDMKPDTYHDQKKLTRLADIADILSWLFLLIFLLSTGIIIYLIVYAVQNHVAVEQFFLSLPGFLVPMILSGFVWIILKLASEGVYLLMDIEDNTRK